MTIIDTFVTIFTSDTEGLKKGQKEAKKTTDELQTSIEKTDKTTAQLGSSFASVVTQLGHAAVGFLSVNALLSNTQQAVVNADQIGIFSRVVGLSTETVSAWSNAVESAGGTSTSFQSAVAGLDNQMLELALTGNSSLLPMLSKLGIVAVDSTGRVKTGFQLLRDIGARLREVPETLAFGLGKRFGFDPALVSILRSGSHEIDALIQRQQRLGVVTREQADIVRQLRSQWNDITIAWRQTGLQTVDRFSDNLSGFLTSIEELAIFMRENEDLMTGFLIALAGAAIYAAAPLLALAAPFIAIAGAMGLVALAYEDIKKYTEGADSITGRVEKGATNVLDFAKFYFKSKFGKNDTAETGTDLRDEIMHDARELLDSAMNNPLSALPAGTLGRESTNVTRQFSISIDTIEVNTQATDVENIANNIVDELRKQTENAIDNFDDGLLA